MIAASSPTSPVKVWAALTAIVLLAHLAVLQGTPMSLGVNKDMNQTQASHAFTTRSVDVVPASPPPPDRTTATAAAVPRKSATPSPPKAARSIASDRPNNSADAAPQTPTIAQADSPPQPGPNPAPPATATEDERPAEADQPLPAPRPRLDRTSVVMAYTIPGSVRFKYKVEANKFPFSASAELLWKQDGETYDARLELSAFGQSRVQTSRGQITAQGLAPTRFSDKYRSEVAAHFDREKGKVTFSANTPDVPLLAGAQDRLSILVQLGAMIAGDPGRYPPATTVAIQTIGPRDSDTWLFTVGSEETLSLPGGEQATLKLVRNPRQEFDQKVELWLAPALGYLPVRIRITEPNGDFIDQKWLATEPQN